MRESTVEDYLVKRVKSLGGEIRKVKWVGHNGAPDRLIGFPACPITFGSGFHMLVELKRPKKKAEAHQKREHKKLHAMGFEVQVLDTKKKIDSVLDYIFGK